MAFLVRFQKNWQARIKMNHLVFSVSELNNYVKACLEKEPVLRNVCVIGEISNYKLYPSGHHYFSLKDSEGTLSCVMFKGQAFSLRFRPENGITVMASGYVSVYPRDGKYQLIVSAMMPNGAGNLQLAFEQLKAKLDAEGLFETGKKRVLPLFPERIAVITSPVGAAIQDVIRILGKRWPMANVLIVPVRVQGSEAPGEICRAIAYVNKFQLADVVITGRGGGTLEDLWAFNEETVARAIFESEIPIISAVGHEPDVTISDYVADRRASTPSNAAEVCVPDVSEIRKMLAAYLRQIISEAENRIIRKKRELSVLEASKVLKSPLTSLNMRRMDLDLLRSELSSTAEKIVKEKRSLLVAHSSSLDEMSPLKVLGRGYSIAFSDKGERIQSISELKQGQKFRLRLSDGTVRCTADIVE